MSTNDKLAEALRNELLRRKVTGLPSKVKLSEQFGLTSLEEVNGWMVKAAFDFEEAAEEFLALHEAEKQEQAGFNVSLDFLKRVHESLSDYCGQLDWGNDDMDLMDEVEAMLATAPQQVQVSQ